MSGEHAELLYCSPVQYRIHMYDMKCKDNNHYHTFIVVSAQRLGDGILLRT